MLRRGLRLIISLLCSGIVLAAAGCTQPNPHAAMPPRSKVARVSRTASDRQRLVRPEGKRRHGDLFDTLNEQIVREVSTSTAARLSNLLPASINRGV